MEGFLFDLMEQHDYENIFFCQEKSTGLKAVIAIHNTTLGPAAGGTRMWAYATETDAIQDALRLARAMTYKMAAIGASFGGGKCVVIGDAKRDKTEALLRALGRHVHRLNGLFLTGVDVGTTAQDMEIMRQESPYVITISKTESSAGGSGAATAFGVLQGMRACLNDAYGSPDLKGRRVAVQGVGAVGKEVVAQLAEAGASITITDVDQERAQRIASDYNARVVSPTEIYSLPVDVYCPCALGAVLNDETIPRLACKIVCGSANNQLAEERHGDMIEQQGIVYAPDYIINAGGTLYYLDIFNPGGFNPGRVKESIARIYESMERVIALARAQHIPTYRAADALAEQHLAEARRNKQATTNSDTSR